MLINHARKDKFVQFARGNVLMRVGANDYTAKVIVGFTSGNNMVLYDVIDFKPVSFGNIVIKKAAMSSPSNRIEAKNSSNITAIDTISQSDTGVNNSIRKLEVFDNDQIKSADPITYDDNGKVIPLSKRFNENNNDIRYSNDVLDDYLKEHYSPKGTGQTIQQLKAAAVSSSQSIAQQSPEKQALDKETNAVFEKKGTLRQSVKVMLTSAQASLEDIAKRTKRTKINDLTSLVRRSGQMAEAMLTGSAQRNIKGEKVGRTVDQIKQDTRRTYRMSGT